MNPSFLPARVVSVATVLVFASAAAAAQRPSTDPIHHGTVERVAEQTAPDMPADARALATKVARPRPPKPLADAEPGISSRPRPAGMFYDLPGDGALWARGDDYKMSFDDAGAVYYPRFGARQLRNTALPLSPDHVSSSGAALAFDGAACATRAGNRVEIDRGAFVEAYDLAPGSIEQTFVFRALPSRGDLVLRIPVMSELEGFSTASGLELRGELGHVEYSRAFAIDARGERADAATELVDGAIELRVDAEFLRTATLPLVIDPVVLTFSIDASSTDNFTCDVAWHDNFLCWFVVYEEVFSAADHDVFARIMNVDGTVRHQAYVDLSSTSWTRPRCGALFAADQFLVAAATNPGGVPSVSGREVSALDMAMFSQLLISRPEDGPVSNPVVGGDPFPALPSRYAVAYERNLDATDADILVRQVNPNNTLVGIVPIPLSPSGDTLDRQPAISKSNDADEWMITWHREESPTNFDVLGARVKYDGTITQPPFYIALSSALEAISSVSSPVGGTHRHLVCFQTVSPTHSDIKLALVDGLSILSTLNLSVAEGFDPALDQIEPSVDSSGTHFVVAYAEEFFGTDYDIYASEVAMVGNSLVVTQAHQNLAFSNTLERRPAIASYTASGGVNPGLAFRYVLAWEDITAGGGNIEGGFFDGQLGGTVTPLCFGDGSSGPCPCSNSGAAGHGCASSVNAQGALLQAVGDASTVSDSIVLQGSGMPNASCLYFQGLGAASSPFGDGLRCVAGTTIRLGTKSNSNGSSQYPGTGDESVHVRGQVPATGGTRFYQAWYRNAASFCTPAAFNLSNGVRIDWIP